MSMESYIFQIHKRQSSVLHTKVPLTWNLLCNSSVIVFVGADRGTYKGTYSLWVQLQRHLHRSSSLVHLKPVLNCRTPNSYLVDELNCSTPISYLADEQTLVCWWEISESIMNIYLDQQYHIITVPKFSCITHIYVISIQPVQCSTNEIVSTWNKQSFV